MNYRRINEIEDFYTDILDNRRDMDVQQVVDIIKVQREKSGFYQLCQSYVDIALNAEKYIDKESEKLVLYNKYLDIDKAIEHTKDFILKNNISDIEKLLDMIKARYVDSISSDDKRQRSGFVPADAFNNSSIGYKGKFYNFTEIPSWGKIKEQIINSLV